MCIYIYVNVYSKNFKNLILLLCPFFNFFPSPNRRKHPEILHSSHMLRHTKIIRAKHISCHQSTHQHICGVKVVLACHIGLQPLRHLLDAFDFIQQLEDMLVLNALYPQLPQLVPFAVEQHLTRQEVFFHLQESVCWNPDKIDTILVHKVHFCNISAYKQKHFRSRYYYKYTY